MVRQVLNASIGKSLHPTNGGTVVPGPVVVVAGGWITGAEMNHPNSSTITNVDAAERTDTCRPADKVRIAPFAIVESTDDEFTVDVDPRLRATEHDNESVPSASGEPLGLRRENGVVSAVRARKDADGPLGIHGPQAKAPGVGEALLRLVSASVRNDDCVFHRR